MQAIHSRLLVLALIFLCGVNHIQSVSVTDFEWNQYKSAHGKTYPSTTAENNARYYYAYNLNLINNHNTYANKGKYTYWLAPNQFTDMRLIHFNALFPQTTQPPRTGATDLPALIAPIVPNAYHPNDQGVVPNVYDQGTSCSSGWAYATTAAIEIFSALNVGPMNPPPLSAQQFIDCASMGKACTGQVPQAAFDYLTMYSLELKPASAYPNDNKMQSPCRSLGAAVGVTLSQYAVGIADGDETKLKAYVSAGYPVVIEINPTSFEFMHYSYGVFQQPATNKGSHHMVVVGYDAENWILLNSFSRTWGEGGYMRLRRSDTKAKLPKSATLPKQL